MSFGPDSKLSVVRATYTRVLSAGEWQTRPESISSKDPLSAFFAVRSMTNISGAKRGRLQALQRHQGAISNWVSA